MEEERENEYVDEKEEKMSISHEHFNAMLERLTGRMHPLTGWFPSIDDALELTLNPVENYEFILWILESNPDMELRGEQKEAYQILQDAMKECTEFTE
ncbi:MULTISPECIES: hypothetical protein [Clostridiaceae]|uniref:hypothetical protein n=1 Tax=Clostridiaceae TaxID=31979 RepID=UPI001C0202B1|nr:hypothetical protein [Clostridium sp. MCC328]MBT9822274.1 hypothetical protein [Clostridium sp. MCC328]MEE1410033.1 hypothetical protein [Eubacterium ramulus]